MFTEKKFFLFFLMLCVLGGADTTHALKKDAHPESSEKKIYQASLPNGQTLVLNTSNTISLLSPQWQILQSTSRQNPCLRVSFLALSAMTGPYPAWLTLCEKQSPRATQQGIESILAPYKAP